jgi:hypothetical protein
MGDFMNISDIPPDLFHKRFRRQESVVDSIDSMPSTYLINLIIELASAVVLIVGVVYLLRFIIVYRSRFDVMYFNLILSLIGIFIPIWGVRVFFRLRTLYTGFRAVCTEKTTRPPRETDNQLQD